jgi:hypothetical protein
VFALAAVVAALAFVAVAPVFAVAVSEFVEANTESLNSKSKSKLRGNETPTLLSVNAAALCDDIPKLGNLILVAGEDNVEDIGEALIRVEGGAGGGGGVGDENELDESPDVVGNADADADAAGNVYELEEEGPASPCHCLGEWTGFHPPSSKSSAHKVSKL